MLNVCLVCLRSDRKLNSIEFSLELENFYDELCEYNITGGTVYKFCYECFYKLKKCFKFKKSCQLATEKLNIWKKEAKNVRKPIALLHKEMAGSQLSIKSNNNNYQVHFFHSSDLSTPTSVEMSRANNTVHFVSDKIIKDENIEEFCVNQNTIEQNDTLKEVEMFDLEIDNGVNIQPDIEIFNDEELKSNDIQPFHEIFNDEVLEIDNIQPFLVISKNEELKIADNIQLFLEISKDEKLENGDIQPFHEISKNEELESDENINNDDNTKYNSDALIKKLEKILKVPEKGSRKRRYPTKPKNKIDLNTIKIKVKEKFKKYGPIKDKQGNIINMIVILDNLDKAKCMNHVIEACRGTGPFNACAIKQLSMLQNNVMYEDVFDTLYLKDPKQMKEEFEKRRELASYEKSEVRCDICLTSFTTPGLLKHHMNTSHDPDLPFECDICHTRNATRAGIYHHLCAHRTVYKCKLCEFATGFKSTMITHYNTHKGNLYCCKYCNGQFTQPSSLYDHINRMHNSKHICNLCGSSFNSVLGLKRHKILKHKDKKFVKSEHNKKCEECNVIFISEDIYNEHLGKSCRLFNKPRDERPRYIKNTEIGGDYLCQICGIQLKYRESIETHMLKHSGSRPYACLKCPKSFYDKLGLRLHMLWHFPPTYTCNFCDKKFHTSTGMNTHKKSHINERKHVCDICGKKFVFPGTLKEHVAGVHQHKRRNRKPRPRNTQ